jgi:hypothetical protein
MTQPDPGQGVPQVQPVIRPPATAAETKPADPGADEQPRDKAARLRREAAAIEATLPRAEGTTRVKVEPPHSELSRGAVVVGNEFVPVSNFQLADFIAAADAAGVKLTIE